MARYQFYKANIADTGLLDIRSTHYRRLLQACFRYSASVAVCMPVDANIDTQRIATFRRKVTPQIRMQYAHWQFHRGGYGSDQYLSACPLLIGAGSEALYHEPDGQYLQVELEKRKSVGSDVFPAGWNGVLFRTYP